MSEPVISVVFPVLNCATTISGAFESVRAQNHPGIDVVVIDGGSEDGTLEIIRQNMSQISYWESGLDSGISDAFNRGIAQAKGEIVAILNCDDSWQPDTLEVVLEAAARNPDADIFCGQIRYMDESTGRSYIRRPDLSRMRQRMHLFHPAIFVRRSAYDRIGGYSTDYRLAMDSEWCHRAMACGLRFHTMDHVLANMRLGGRSDDNFRQSLLEYRRSLLHHKLARRLEADYYFAKYSLLKTLTRSYYLRLMKQKLLC